MGHLVGWEAILAVLVIAVLAFPLAVQADIIYANADSYVVSIDPGGVYGSETSLYVVGVGGGNPVEVDAYLNFDVTNAVPAGCTFQSATLWLAVSSFVSPATVEAHKASGAWNEATLTWGNRPGYEATVLDSQDVTFQDYLAVWKSWDVSAGWPGTGDFRLVMVIPPSSNTQTSFFSREYADLTYAPYLDIRYTQDASVPEPGTLGLLGVLALPGWMLARKRRRTL